MKRPREKTRPWTLKIAVWVLSLWVNPMEEYGLFGDLEELYQLHAHSSRKSADWAIFIHLFKTLPVVMANAFYWRLTMFTNYIKMAFRNFKRSKGYSLINVLGLALGMACSILILLWVRDELSYDGFHENLDRLYRVYERQTYSNQEFHFPDTPGPLVEKLKNDFPEVVRASHYLNVGGHVIRWKEKNLGNHDVTFVDNDFLQMFTFPLKKGEVKTALEKPFSMVISQETARAFFGDEDALGQVIQIDNQHDFTITGVMEKIPRQSSMRPDILIPFDNTMEILNRAFTYWGNNWPRTLIQLSPETDHAEFASKIRELILTFIPESSVRLFLQPVKQWHLYSLTGEKRGVTYVYLFSLIAVFIIVLACINFMNLSTARSVKRALEVGLRKTVGARRSQMFAQFLGESVILTFLSLGTALVFCGLFLPVFNTMAGKSMTWLDIFHGPVLFMIFAIALFTGLVSGSYPAFVLSSFQPVNVLKGTIQKGKASGGFRRILVVLQFTVTILLIIATLVVYKQMRFIDQRDLGYNQHQVMGIYMQEDAGDRYEILKHEVLKSPDVMACTATSIPPISSGNSSSGFDWEGREADLTVLINQVFCDYNYLEAMGMTLAAGRDFQKELDTENTPGFILNEEAIRRMGLKDPVGKRFTMSEAYSGRIIGVVKDFHFSSLHREIEPMVINALPEQARFILIRLPAHRVQQGIEAVKNAWQNVNPHIPISYRFLEDYLDTYYEGERRVGTLFKYFTGLAIFIASLGLLGLASFLAQQKTKEIGIRKVLGASQGRILLLLTSDFSKWILLANGVAWPVGFYLMNLWLAHFSYRTHLSLDIFLLAGSVAFIIAWMTVSFHAVRAARANPSNSLRYQ